MKYGYKDLEEQQLRNMVMPHHASGSYLGRLHWLGDAKYFVRHVSTQHLSEVY